MSREMVEFATAFSPVRQDSGVPLFRQVVVQVESALRRGVLSTEQYLPPEPELCEGFGVARSTVRRAMSYMIEAGIVERRQGDGTRIVSQARLDFFSGASPSMYADLQAAHRHPTTRILSHASFDIDAEAAARTSFTVGQAVVFVRRLRSAGEVPLAVMENTLAASAVRFEVDELVDASLDAVLRAHEVVTTDVDYQVEPVLIDAERADSLGIDAGTPVLREKRWGYTSDGGYVNFSTNYYHPQNFHFAGRLSTD